MLFRNLEESAKSSGEIELVKLELLKLYKKKKDKSIFEALLILAKRYGGSLAVDQLIETELTSQRLNIESIYRASNYAADTGSTIDSSKALLLVNKGLEGYLNGVPAFRCEHCGYKMHDYLWRCPACHEWDSIDHA